MSEVNNWGWLTLVLVFILGFGLGAGFIISNNSKELVVPEKINCHTSQIQQCAIMSNLFDDYNSVEDGFDSYWINKNKLPVQSKQDNFKERYELCEVQFDNFRNEANKINETLTYNLIQYQKQESQPELICEGTLAVNYDSYKPRPLQMTCRKGRD